jgi:DNA-binding beta-propeller fold protein YncE/ABC-type spermidine/putrescine transport system permease subunit II
MIDGALWRITFRQLLGPLVAGFAMVSVLAMQEFSIWDQTDIRTVSTEVRSVYLGTSTTQGLLASQEQRMAAALVTGLPLIGVILGLALLASWLVRKMSASEHVEVGAWPRVLDAGGVWFFLTLLVIFLTLIVPTGAMWISLKAPLQPGRILKEFAPQMGGSLGVAGLAGIVALIAALGAAAKRSSGALFLGILAFLVGGQMIAIAMIHLFNRQSLSLVYDGPGITVMAYLARFLWVALLAAQVGWTRPWRQLRDLAAVDGAGAMRTAVWVIWPLLLPVLGGAAVLVMILSLSEVPATALIAPIRPPMLVPNLLQWVHMQRYDPMIEASLVTMGLVAGLATIAGLLMWMGVKGSWMFGKRWWAITPTLLVFLLMGCGKGEKPEEIWCETGAGPGQVIYPRAIAYSAKDDTFFIVDRHAHVQHLDRHGNCLHDWQMPDRQKGKPVGLTVGPDGLVYVPDTHYSRVMVYTPEGKVVRQWGKMGRGPGEFVFPTDVAFDDKGRVFVSEYSTCDEQADHDRIQVFDMQGKYLYEFGKFGNGEGEFSRPQSMVIDGNLLYITDACNHRIVVFTTEGKFVRNMGNLGSGLGQFRFPYGLDMDSKGRLVVCEFGNNRVQWIDKATGAGIKTWGEAGREPGQLAYPWATAVDKKDRIVTLDSGNNRIQVFK